MAEIDKFCMGIQNILLHPVLTEEAGEIVDRHLGDEEPGKGLINFNKAELLHKMGQEEVGAP